MGRSRPSAGCDVPKPARENGGAGAEGIWGRDTWHAVVGRLSTAAAPGRPRVRPPLELGSAFRRFGTDGGPFVVNSRRRG